MCEALETACEALETACEALDDGIERLLLVRHAPGASAPPPAVPDSEALQDGNDEGRTTASSSSVARAHTQSRAHRSSAHVHQLRAPRTPARKVSVPTMPVPVVGIGAHPAATRVRSPGAQGAALVRSGRWSASVSKNGESPIARVRVHAKRTSADPRGLLARE
jgi:hypothetical protein